MVTTYERFYNEEDMMNYDENCELKEGRRARKPGLRVLIKVHHFSTTGTPLPLAIIV